MICDICKKEVPSSNFSTRIIDGKTVGLCGKHYAQYIKYGKFLDNSPKTIQDQNQFKIDGDIVKVYTVRKNCEISGYFIIDKTDLDLVICRKWRMWNGYFFTGVKNPIMIHRFLLNASDNVVVDHINHLTYDNRRCNLRATTQQRNVQNQSLKTTNTSGISGVWFDISRDKWCAEIKCNYLKCFLGRYDTIEDASYARLVAEEYVFGEYRNTANDNKLLPAANASTQKDKIKQYITDKIKSKFL